MAKQAIRVLVIDDSPTIRAMMQSLLSKDPGIEVIGTAANAYEGREKVIQLQPDVLTLDIHMPGVDGMVFLEKLMKGRPMPVIMVSASTQQDAELSLRALDLGAVDFITKPALNTTTAMSELAEDLTSKIKAAAAIPDIRRHVIRQRGRLRLKMGRPVVTGAAPAATRSRQRDPIPQINQKLSPTASQHVIAIGASTGGTEAIREVLEPLPPYTPGIVIVQHMPEHFTEAFANRLNTLCALEVREAKDQDAILPGRALLAPGGKHMMVRRGVKGYFVNVKDGPLVCSHRPSVEVLFQSVATTVGDKAIGVMLTGMGGDGSRAMAQMRQAGARTIAQDEESCVVFGMPREAIRLGAVEKVLPLNRIAKQVLDYLS